MLCNILIGDEEGNLSEEADGLAEAAAKNLTNRKTATGGKKKGKDMHGINICLR